MEVTLALGGGGLKGFAHIGVLRYLKSCGIRVKAIAGSSAGGLFGALYASGYNLDDFEDRLVYINQNFADNKMYNRLPGDGPSILGLGGVVAVLEDILGDMTFDDLLIPMAMTAVDLDTGELVIMNRGRVLDAVLATIALPGIFPPRVWEQRLMVDGGVLDPVPVSIARSLAPGLPVAAVVLTPKLKSWNGQRKPPSFLSAIPFIERFYRFRFAQSLNIFLRSVDIATALLSDLRLEIEQPDVVIRPAVGHVELLKPVDIIDTIQLGERATEDVMIQFNRLVDWRYRISDRIPWLSSFFRKASIDS
jgi:NTE family protein